MRVTAVVIFVLLVCGLFLVSRQAAEEPESVSTGRHPDHPVPIFRTTAAHAASRPVSALQVLRPTSSFKTYSLREIGANTPPALGENATHDADQAIARSSLVAMPTPSLSFIGLSNYDNITAFGAVIIPPDTIGDVGPNHYVQAVNALVRIFDKDGRAITQPFKMSQLFEPLGTACSTRDDGEPVVLYDSLADRWLLSQYCNNFPPFRQMIAVSKTGDPEGAYHLYEFVMPNIRLNDVAKFGVWPDGYYMSTEEFIGSDFAGVGIFAFERAKMLAGDASAAYIYFNRPSTTTSRRSNLLAADLDGLIPPPAGSPNVFIGYTATEYGDARDAIRLFDFHADFANPLSSTFTEQAESPLAVAAFDPTSPDGRTDISQPAPGEKLDANSDRLNYRASYRNLGTSESIVVNQTVRLSSEPYRAGVRLYELRRAGGVFSVAEQATIGNGPSSRWIAGAAQDHQGNLAVGYNHVADDKPPSIYYTGKLASEPAGTFRDEATLIEGTGVQKAFGFRWGDYSGMSVDPADDCTFWMTGEYYTLESQNFSDFTWLTRIGKFKFPECTPAPRAAITGIVTNIASGEPVAKAMVTASVYSRTTATNGSYGSLAVLPGTYTVTASASGFRGQTVTVNLANGQTMAQNFSLQPIPVLRNVGISFSNESCAANGAPDPGERLTISVPIRNTGVIRTQNLVATLLATGGVTDPGSAQTYGTLSVNGPSITRQFSFTVSPGVVCGGAITLTFRLQDGAEDLGSINVAIQTGTQKIAFRENFDRVALSGLPQRWTRSATDTIPAGIRNWTISARRSQSAAKSAFSPDLSQIGLNELVTPVISITSPSARVAFRNRYEFESTFLRNRLYDGSVLEIRIGNSEWQDIIAAGGVFESGGYDGPLDACCQNPLATRQGWSGRSGTNELPEFITTAVGLPPTAAGQQIQLRWRVGTDIGGLREGQYIDDLIITDGFTCDC